MTNKDFSRRQFIKGVPSLSLLLWPAIFLAGCEQKSGPDKNANLPEPSHCSDLSGVSEQDKELREKFAYTDHSPIADNQCNNCNLYLPAQKDKKCGGCMLFRGPVQASGYCAYWAPKVDNNI